MIDIEYANACSEVLEILKYIHIEDYKKIPKSKIEVFETDANKNYSFKYNPNKTLDEQNVSKRAKAIIGLLFRDYWATEKQREKIIAKQNYDRQKFEVAKKEKYNLDNIFENKNVLKEQQIVSNEKRKMLVIQKEKWYKKIFNIIKNLFKKN